MTKQELKKRLVAIRNGDYITPHLEEIYSYIELVDAYVELFKKLGERIDQTKEKD